MTIVRPLRILMLADMVPNPNSGAAGTELCLAAALEELGHEVVRVWGNELPHRLRHWNLHHLLEQPRAYRAAIRRHAGQGEFDVFHVNQPAGWLAARDHRRRGGRALFAHRSHGFEPRIGAVVRRWQRIYPEDRRSVWRRVASVALGSLLVRHHRAVAREAEVHVVSCSECAEFLVKWGVERERIHISPQVPLDEFVLVPPRPWSPERSHRILYIGQHAFFKAPMVVSAVLTELLETDAELEVTWIVERSAHPMVRARLALAGTAERVRLLDWMDMQRLREIYDTHGVFLFPSFVEGFGKVFLEAMARGVVVVATEQGGARDVIRSGENGLLAPVGDVAALVANVRRLRTERGLAQRLGEAGRQAAEQYTWRGTASALAEFYAERLAAKRGSW